jgi:uncharacterized protein
MKTEIDSLSECGTLSARVANLDWSQIYADLERDGFALTGRVLNDAECARLTDAYDDSRLYRSRILMERHGFGRGEYQYFSYPLPDTVDELRKSFYAPLAQIANVWNVAMKVDVRFPSMLDQMLARCHDAGQMRPTPLILKYVEGDYNCLHQDLYGEHVFPLQVAFLLSEPTKDFEGGEFVLTEQRPRMQSRVSVARMNIGEGVIFAVHTRPVHGARGAYRVNLKHGVSKLTSGKRFSTGIIFHDAT